MSNAKPQLVRLFPQPDDATLITIEHDDISAQVAQEPRVRNRDRPWVYANMVTSLDGGTAVSGVSGGLGGPADKAVFAGLRDAADFILVGASTVRSERYRPPNRSDEVSQARRVAGRSAHPRLAVVTGSANLAADLPLFDDPSNRPIVLTVRSADSDAVAALSEVADVVAVGEESVDLDAALSHLGDLGGQAVLAEGGPGLNGQLIEAGLIDEWNLTLSPHLLAGNSARAAYGELEEGPPAGMCLKRVWADDDFLFCRWVRA